MSSIQTTYEAIPNTMRAAVLRKPGEGPEVEEIHTPHPKRGEVLVKVTACGLCHSDLHVINGAIAFPTPAVLGHEVSGTIVEVGPGTLSPNVQLGMNVCGAFLMPCGKCSACSAGRDDLCAPFFELNRLKGQLFDGTSRLSDLDGEVIAQYSMGGLAEYCVIPATAVAAAAPELDHVASSIIGCAAMTAYGAVRRGADLRYGETVAIIGIGGVGSNIVQLCREMGARRIIALDIDDAKLKAAEALGATHTVNSRERDAREAIFDITHGQGADVVFEALGMPFTFQQALTLLADGGRMVPVGLAAGAETAAVPINQLVRRGQQIRGSYGARTRTDLAAVIDLAARGKINYREVVTDRVPLEKAAETYERLERGGVRGRAVVEMALEA